MQNTKFSSRSVVLISILALQAAAISGAQADPLTQKLLSRYEAKKPWVISLQTIVMGEDNQAIAAEVMVAAEGCSGAMSGLGTSDGTSIKIKPYMATSQEAEQCELSIELDKTGKIATISESHCGYFHGVQCAFAGTLHAK